MSVAVVERKSILASMASRYDMEPEAFERVLRNLDVMLAHERIHGDLSAYNILYWDGDITLIDFPQVVSPRVNRHAYRIFERDMKRICDYFTQQGIKTNPKGLAQELWTSRGYPIPQAKPDPQE